MHTLRMTVVAAALAVAAAAGAAGAQTNVGTAVGDFLLIEPAARAAGMGNAGAALMDGLQSVYFNPAAIGELGNRGVEFTHCNWLADITYRYVAASMPLNGSSNMFASVTALSSGDIDVRTVAQPLGTGEKYSVSDVAVSLGYGRRVSERFSAGVQVNYVQESIWNSSASTVTVSVGTLYRVSENGLHLGASICNYGTQARFGGRDLRITYPQDAGQNGSNNQLPGEVFTDEFPVPVMFRVGAGLPLQLGKTTRLDLALDALHPSDNTESMCAGVELDVRNSLSLRAGWQDLFQKDSETGLTLGAGVRGSFDETRFHLDFAWADNGRLESTQRLTLGVTF